MQKLTSTIALTIVAVYAALFVAVVGILGVHFAGVDVSGFAGPVTAVFILSTPFLTPFSMYTLEQEGIV